MGSSSRLFYTCSQVGENQCCKLVILEIVALLVVVDDLE